MAIITVTKIREKKNIKKITMLTAYDYQISVILNEMKVDIILIGDSLGMVALGYKNTLPVTMEEMIHHTKAVARAVNYSLVIGDMPFLSYQVDTKEAIFNAGRFIKEAGATAVKLEGGEEVIDKVRAIVNAGIPVMGHIGLTPQYCCQMGGYKVQGRNDQEAKKILKDAQLLEKAGVFSLVLECIPSLLAMEITKLVSIPTIGIGAGKHCDGQVLVTNDLLGISNKKMPKFVRKYANLDKITKKAIKRFIRDVEMNSFPSEEESYQ
ncbi:MAG: 3-methyl-2-oxobutanoate hydroxymethyltransferase [bacterium]|nr:3-methyl-2-oxobutanoate hydroxymethyltransferase [bacterium]